VCIADTNLYLWQVLWENGTCTDSDDDDYFAEQGCGSAVDCDDTDPDVNPDAIEDCSDGIDNDCDGNADCADDVCVDDPAVCTCTDADNDGFYLEVGCGSSPVDCNDADAAVNPGAAEVEGDSIDNDCDGEIDNPVDAGDSDDSDSSDSKNTGCFIDSMF
jgi:hypothetical protein